MIVLTTFRSFVFLKRNPHNYASVAQLGLERSSYKG